MRGTTRAVASCGGWSGDDPGGRVDPGWADAALALGRAGLVPLPHGEATRSCPCGSGAAYRACCGPVHDGSPAATAEQLMRSRYTAFALGIEDHVFRTWHPRTRPDDLS